MGRGGIKRKGEEDWMMGRKGRRWKKQKGNERNKRRERK